MSTPSRFGRAVVVLSSGKNFSRAYLNHLFRAAEITYFRLASIHNIHYYLQLMRDAREAILANNWTEFKKEFYAKRSK